MFDHLCHLFWGKTLYLTLLTFEEERTALQHWDAKYFFRWEGALKRLLNSSFFVHSFFIRHFVTFLKKRPELEHNSAVNLYHWHRTFQQEQSEQGLFTSKICSIRPLSLSSFMMRHGDIYPLVYIKVSELLLIYKNSCWKKYYHSFYYLCSWCMEYLWIQSCILFKRQTEEAIKPKSLLKHLVQDSFEWIIICEKTQTNHIF